MPEQRVYIPRDKTRYFLVAILLSGGVTMINTSTVTISLPTYMKVFNIDINTVQWVVIVYLLPLVMVMPLSEYLCERFSYRKTFLFAVAMMCICSLGCAISFNFWMLVFFRFAKGIAGGIIIPTIMALLYRYTPTNKQAKYLGYNMLFQSLGVALGPTIAGIILEVSTWHILFLFNVPLLIIIYWASGKSIPAEAENSDIERIDFLGCGQVSLGSGLIMLGFSMAQVWGWNSIKFWLCVGVGVSLVVLFIVRQFRMKHPLLDFGVLKYKDFAFTTILQCVIALTLGINAILSQFYFQTVREISPAITGLLLMAPSIAMMIGNTITNFLHEKGLMRSLIIGGLTIALIGNLGLCDLKMDSYIPLVISCYCLRFFGIALAQMPLTNFGLSSVPRELSGHASSMFNWSKQLVQTVSTNILTVLLSMNMARYYLEAGNTGAPVEGSMAYRLAAIEAVNTDYVYIAIFLVIAVVFSLFVGRKKKTN